MEPFLIDHPDYDTILDWTVEADGSEKPLRYLNAADLERVSGVQQDPRLAHAYISVARILPVDAVIEDLDPADFELAFWGSGNQ